MRNSFWQNHLISRLAIFIPIFLLFWFFLGEVSALKFISLDQNIPPASEYISRYILIIFLSLFLLYLIFSFVIYRYKKFSLRLDSLIIIYLIFMAALFFIFPLISSDVLNYPIYTRIFTVYKENPYLISPDHFFQDIYYQTWINKNFEDFIMPYGPAWFSISILPTWLGGENIKLTLYFFKLIAALFNLGCIVLIYKILTSIKPGLATFLTLLYVFNPFILFQVIVDGHNDIVMAFFFLLAIYLLQKKKFIYSGLALAASILIKFLSILLLPLFFVYLWQEVRWRVFIKTVLAMIILALVFCISYGCLNFEALKNIIARGGVVYLPGTSVVVFLVDRISSLIIRDKALFLTYGLLAFLFVVSYLFISLKNKKNHQLISLIDGSVLIYIAYFLLLCFLFWEWYLLWLLPLPLLWPTKRNMILFFLLTLLGFMAIFTRAVEISIIGLVLFGLIYFSSSLLSKKIQHAALFKNR